MIPDVGWACPGTNQFPAPSPRKPDSTISGVNRRAAAALPWGSPRVTRTVMPLFSWRDRWHGPGGGRELLALAWPLIVSNSFFTLQIAIDRALLSHSSSDEVAAAMAAVLLFWTPFALLQFTANYATVFVSQYLGAGRPSRVGPAVGQSLYFSVVAGLVFLAVVWPSAVLGLGVMLRPRYRREFATHRLGQFEPELFRRLLRFGIPNGIMVALDALAFTLFTFLVGRLGAVELAATSVAFTLNAVVFLPAMGVAQAVEVLVGRRLGEDRPDVAERTTWTGTLIVGA